MLQVPVVICEVMMLCSRDLQGSKRIWNLLEEFVLKVRCFVVLRCQENMFHLVCCF